MRSTGSRRRRQVRGQGANHRKALCYQQLDDCPPTVWPPIGANSPRVVPTRPRRTRGRCNRRPRCRMPSPMQSRLTDRSGQPFGAHIESEVDGPPGAAARLQCVCHHGRFGQPWLPPSRPRPRAKARVELNAIAERLIDPDRPALPLRERLGVEEPPSGAATLSAGPQLNTYTVGGGVEQEQRPFGSRRGTGLLALACAPEHDACEQK